MTFSEPNAHEYSVNVTATAKTTDAPDASDASGAPDVAKDPNGVPTGAWATSFCGCLDTCVPNALMAFLCPGVSLAQILARLGLAPFMNVIAAFAGVYALAFVAWVSGWLLFNVLLCIVALALALGVAKLRVTLRALFAIPGDVWGDCLLAFFCGPCAIAQMATHVDAYTPGSCDFRPRETLPGYSWH